MTERGHEFISVGDRRWCVCCDLFQQRKPGYVWRDPPNDCPRNTPYAKAHPIEQLKD